MESVAIRRHRGRRRPSVPHGWVGTVGIISTVLLVACSGPRDGAVDDEATFRAPPPGPPITERPLLAASTAARQALEVGDWASARQHLEAALAHAPGLPQTRFRLAEVILRQGDPGPAMEHLQALVAMGAKVDLAASDVFAPFLDIPELAVLARALHPSTRPASEATLLATLPRDQWTEGIAIDPTTGMVYAGSLERHHILKIAPDGTMSDFVRDDAARLPSLVGMAIDAERRHLWVAAGAGSDQPVAASPRSNGLFQYGLDSGERIAEHLPDDDVDRQRLLNDLVVAPDGAVYVTESFESALWRLTPGGRLHRWKVFPEMAYLNGVAIADDGSMLWAVAVEGLVWVDPATGDSGRVVGDAAFFAGMGDGMATFGEGLVLVQNEDFLGQRIASFTLDGTGQRITSAEVLPFDWPPGLLPYTLAVDEVQVVVVAAADLRLRGTPDAASVPPPVLLRWMH